jgi:hypothetical protein
MRKLHVAFHLTALFSTFLLTASTGALAQQMRLNQVTVDTPPVWIKAARIQRVVDRLENKLEWDIRKIRVVFYADQAALLKEFGVSDAPISAFARKTDQSVHLGPKVDPQNFDAIFGHELSHVISYQKYKEAIPRWLEEGLANLVSKNGKPDYVWLASQNPLPHVQAMGHPFKAVTTGQEAIGSIRLHYEASHALADLLATRCGLHDLLQLSMGSSVEKYIATLCGIADLDKALRDWVGRKAKAGAGHSPLLRN